MNDQDHSSVNQSWRYTQIVERYIRGTGSDKAGQFTIMLRNAFAREKHHQKKIYLRIIASLILLCIIISAWAGYNYYRLKDLRFHAEKTFYDIKSMEIKLAEDLRARRITNAQYQKSLEEYRSSLESMTANYDEMIDTLDIYGNKNSKEQRLILKMARVFGECEINMPDEFIEEVQRYIKIWQSNKRLRTGIMRAKKKGYVNRVVEIMREHDLPPQFFYLALQESVFNVDAYGPKTSWGIAKGAWQFIPDTGRRYGLRTGPMVEKGKTDPHDDRHHFGRSTLAAARYLRDIYDTDAQASGLLVMASYNWGERRVIKLINSFPKIPLFDQMKRNPRDRNFWQILSKYKDKIPKETYDYVFYIFSAAVIGQDPRLFGFDFDNPLSSAMDRASMKNQASG